MLFGRIIVIKRDGQDGSVFPVTIEKTLIGRSKECNIRVQLPSIDNVHCAILIKENREPYIHNLSENRPLTLNGRIINPSEMMKLKSNDVFNIGERAFRYIAVTQVRRPSILKKVSFTTSKIELENSAAKREMKEKIVYSSPQLISTSKSIPPSNVVKHISTSDTIKSNDTAKNVSSTVTAVSKTPSRSKSTSLAARKPPCSTGKLVSHVSCYRPMSSSKTASKILCKSSQRADLDVKSSPTVSKQRVKSPAKSVSTINRKIDPMTNLRKKLKRSSIFSSFKGRTPPQSTTKIPIPKSSEEISKNLEPEQAGVTEESSSCGTIDSTESSSLLSLKLTPPEKGSKTTPRSSSSKLKRENSTSLRDFKITPSSKVVVSENTPTLDFADHSISLPLSEKSVKITPKLSARKSSATLQDLKLTPFESSSITSENSTPSLIVTPKFSAENVKQEKINSLRRSRSTSSTATISTEKRRSSRSAISKLDFNDENESCGENSAGEAMLSSPDKTEPIETRSCVISHEDLEQATMTPKLNDTVEKLCEDLCHTVTEQIKRSLAQNFPILEHKSVENDENVDRFVIKLAEAPNFTKVQSLPIAEVLDENEESSSNKTPVQTKVRFTNFTADENPEAVFSPITPNLDDIFRESSGRNWKNVRKTPIRTTKSKIQPSTPNLSGLFDTPEATKDGKIENPFILQLSCRITTEDKEIFHKNFVAQSVKVEQPQTITEIDQPSLNLGQNIDKYVGSGRVETPRNESSIWPKKACEPTNSEITKPPEDEISVGTMAQGDHDVTHGSELSSIRRSSRLATREKTFTPKAMEPNVTPVRRMRRALDTVTEFAVEAADPITEESVAATEEKPKTSARAKKKSANSHTTEEKNGDGDSTKVAEIPVESTALIAEDLATKFEGELKTRARITKKNIKSQTIEKQIGNEYNAKAEEIPVDPAALIAEDLATKIEGKPKTRGRTTKKDTESQTYENQMGNRMKVKENPVESTASIAEEIISKTRARVTRKKDGSHAIEEHIGNEEIEKTGDTLMELHSVQKNDEKNASSRSTRKRAPTAENAAHIEKNVEAQQSMVFEIVTTEVLEQSSVKPKKSRKTVKSSEKQNEPAKVVQKVEEPIVEKRTLRSSTRNQKK